MGCGSNQQTTKPGAAHPMMHPQLQIGTLQDEIEALRVKADRYDFICDPNVHIHWHGARGHQVSRLDIGSIVDRSLDTAVARLMARRPK